MGWKSLGRDAVNRNTKSLEFEARIPETKCITTAVDYELYEAFKSYCDKTRIKQSQLIRHLIAKEVLPEGIS